MTVAVVTDSAADLPPGFPGAQAITVVPLTVTIAGRPFLDGPELPAESFWERMAADPTPPETASPSPGALLEAHRDAARAGADGVVSVHLRTALADRRDRGRGRRGGRPAGRGDRLGIRVPGRGV